MDVPRHIEETYTQNQISKAGGELGQGDRCGHLKEGNRRAQSEQEAGQPAGEPHRKLRHQTKPPPWWLPPEGSCRQQGGTSSRGQAEQREVGVRPGREADATPSTCTLFPLSCLRFSHVQNKRLNSTISQDFPRPGFLGSVSVEF